MRDYTERDIVRVRVSTVIKAIEKNGYVHYRGGWFQERYGPGFNRHIVGACILGQGALNLGITSGSMREAMKTIEDRFDDEVITMNDIKKMPYERMVEIIKEKAIKNKAMNKLVTVYKEHYLPVRKINE